MGQYKSGVKQLEACNCKTRDLQVSHVQADPGGLNEWVLVCPCGLHYRGEMTYKWVRDKRVKR